MLHGLGAVMQALPGEPLGGVQSASVGEAPSGHEPPEAHAGPVPPRLSALP